MESERGKTERERQRETERQRERERGREGERQPDCSAPYSSTGEGGEIQTAQDGRSAPYLVHNAQPQKEKKAEGGGGRRTPPPPSAE